MRLERYLLGFGLLLGWQACAQEAGSIHGRVTDPQAAAVPNVKITIEQVGTTLTRSAATGAEGTYNFANVSSGSSPPASRPQKFEMRPGWGAK